MINNKERVPMGHYAGRYAAARPEDLSARSGAPFYDGAFHVTMLGQPLYAPWPEFSLNAEQAACPGVLLDSAARLLVIQFLLEGTSAPSSGKFLAYRELPWGEVYDKNFQGHCVRRLTSLFGSRPGELIRAAEKLGGAAFHAGDAAVELPLFEDVRIRLILHAGDEEFPPTSQFLFSDNASAAFTAEDLFACGNIVISALKACAE